MVVKYIFIFHLKNGAGANNEFWCIFINMWVFSSMLISNGVNWFLPGLYSPTYEMCACTSQDYNLPSKFDNTNSVLVLVTITAYIFVSGRIKFYKNKNKHQENQAERRTYARNKLIAELTLTIGPALLIVIVFLVHYLLGKARSNISDNQNPSYLIIHLQFLIALPLIFNIFVIIFFIRNKDAKKVLVREWNNHEI